MRHGRFSSYQQIGVPDEILIDRCVGRRLDPGTGKIYHIKNFPPETDEIKAKVITRPDDTEEKSVKRRNVNGEELHVVSETPNLVRGKNIVAGIGHGGGGSPKNRESALLPQKRYKTSPNSVRDAFPTEMEAYL
ncbi:adenylate kinase family protein [Actinidia rufa]|uniref:Adenylate kinase family protein n=1 Tax=Actinidia rufa TaxID=165716 RepID=A0A7J0E4C9_9ERIC|nr:adenylate kinase family protein [Actinidia rufa]